MKSGQFTRERTLGEKNTRWKGDSVGYFGLHSWVYRTLGKAKKCVECGSMEHVQWANKSKRYKRIVSDWLQLCSKCHRQYDIESLGRKPKIKIGKSELQEMRSLVKSWKEVAVRLGVTERTVYNHLAKVYV